MGDTIAAMEHLVFGAYLACLSTGLLGLASLWFLTSRHRGLGLGLLVWINAFLVLGLVAMALDFYLGLVGLLPDGAGAGPSLLQASHLTSALSMIGIYSLVCFSFSRFAPEVAAPGIRLAGSLLAGLEILSVLLGLLGRLGGGRLGLWLYQHLSTEAYSLASFALVAAILLLLAMLFLRFGVRQSKASLKVLAFGYAIVALVFAAAGPLEWGLARLSLSLPRAISLDFIALLGWNLSAIAAAVLELGARQSQGGLLPGLPREKAEALGLTPREVDMALLIAQGLANKEIGARLGISEATVRTHIYNLYRKVGVTSRIGLLARLRD